MVIAVPAIASATGATQNSAVRPTPALAGEYGVDQQLEHGQHRAEDGEQPIRSSTSAYSAPPMKTIATSDEEQAPSVQATPGPAPSPGFAPGRASFAGRRHRRERGDDHELRKEEHGLRQDQAAGVQTRVVLVEHVASDHDVGVRQREERQQCRACCAWTPEPSSAASRCARPRDERSLRSSHQPTATEGTRRAQRPSWRRSRRAWPG